ncbi:TldD/PmbA family protein, partial [Candidatus Woesearchaeota archaeon]
SSNDFLLKNGVVEKAGFSISSGLGIRYLINDTPGFVSINRLDKELVKRLLERSISLTKDSSRISKRTCFSDEKTRKDDYKVKQKIGLNDLEADEKMKVLQDIEKELNSLKVKVPGRYLSLSDALIKKYYVNSEGSKVSSEIPKINFFYFLTVLVDNQQIQRFWQYGSSSGYEILEEWNLKEKLRDEVLGMEKNAKHGVKAPAKKLDVVCSPEVAGIIAHEAAGHPYEADRILGRESAQAGESFVTKEMINTRIGSEVVNLVDDPTVKNSFGFYKYDDEGVKARQKLLIRKGIINEFLHNRETAKELGTKSNASARANGFDVEPLIRMSNTFFLPGEYGDDEIIEDTKIGIYFKNFMEWNIDDVRLNQKYVANEAYLIENGELTRPVKRPAIEITTPVLYSSINAVAKTVELHAATCGKGEPMQGIPVTMGGPRIRIANIRVH